MIRRRGVTLVESLVAVALAATVIGVAVFAYLAWFGVAEASREAAEARQATLRLFRALEADLRVARAVAASDGSLELVRPADRAAAAGESPLLRVSYRLSAGAAERRAGEAVSRFPLVDPARPGAVAEGSFLVEGNRLRAALRLIPRSGAEPIAAQRDFGLPALDAASGDWRAIGDEGAAR